MAKPHLLITGSNGLVASQFMAQYQNEYIFDTIDLSNTEKPVDITQLEQVKKAVSDSNAQAIIHCAAFTNVSEAWKQENNQLGTAYQVNVIGTKNVVQAATETKKHLIHISTPYIFDGSLDGLYSELQPASPIEWYGYTKAEAEQVITGSSASWTIFRIDQPFRSLPFSRPDTVRRIVTGLQTDTLPPQFIDHTFGPTFLDDFSHVLQWAAKEHVKGIFNATSGEQWTDFAFAEVVKSIFALPGTVHEGTLATYLAQSNRPYQKNTAMSTEKLRRAYGPQKSIKEALELVRAANNL